MDKVAMERERAIERRRNGERVKAICRSLKRSRSWFYKWLDRANNLKQGWSEARSTRPLDNTRYDAQMRERIVETRKRLDGEGCFVGAEMIAWELQDAGIEPPSIATIKRVLKREGLTSQKRREAKGTRYPAPMAVEPGAVHQADFVGPRHASRIRFYSLNAVDVSTARAGAQPLRSRATEEVIPGLWNLWLRLGIPSLLQVDNELVFFGNRRYPRSIGQVLRLCFASGVEVMFIPIREPWRNSIVEKFNDHWNRKFYRRVNVTSFEHLRTESLRFEQQHNSRWRYSRLGGKTPASVLTASNVNLRFPDRPVPPSMPLPRLDHGRVHFVRLIRSDQQIEIFGQRFRVPPEATYEYVTATIDLSRQRLELSLHAQIIDSQPYLLK